MYGRGGGGFSTTLLTAIQKHRDANVLFIAAAGNGKWLHWFGERGVTTGMGTACR